MLYVYTIPHGTAFRKSALPADVEKMVCAPQQFTFLGDCQIPIRKRVKIFVRNGKIRPFFDALQKTVRTGCRDPCNRFSIKQMLELFNIISGEQLLFEVPYPVIRCKVLFLAGCPVSEEIVCVHDGKDGDEGKHQNTSGLCDANGLVNCPADIFRFKQMVHGAQKHGHIEGIIRESAEARGVTLKGMKV